MVTLPETNTSHLKVDGWKTSFLLGPGLFSGAKILVSGSVGLGGLHLSNQKKHGCLVYIGDYTTQFYK